MSGDDMEVTENLVQWITGERYAFVTFSQKKYIDRIKELQKKYPDKIDIKGVNDDGSIYARIPVKAVKINLSTRVLTDQQKKDAAERLKKARRKKK
jgi:hypothetical protein